MVLSIGTIEAYDPGRPIIPRSNHAREDRILYRAATNTIKGLLLGCLPADRGANARGEYANVDGPNEFLQINTL